MTCCAAAAPARTRATATRVRGQAASCAAAHARLAIAPHAQPPDSPAAPLLPPPAGGPLLIRNPTTRAAAVLGVTSHGPDCLAGPNYQHGYYTDVRLYLDAIETWRQGKVYVWSPSSNTSASGTTPTPATPVAQPGDYQPSPVEWQPVPGWEDQWGSGWTGGNTGGSTPGSSGTTTNAGWSWQDVFCQVFGQC